MSGARVLQARLYVDGQQFAATRRNPHVVDDWPLHRDQRVHSTKLVVGACWQGPPVFLLTSQLSAACDIS